MQDSQCVPSEFLKKICVKLITSYNRMRDLNIITTNFEDANKRKTVTFFYKTSIELKSIFFE